MGSGKWTVSTNEEHWGCADEFDTEEEAILAAPECLAIPPGVTFYVGQKRPPDIPEIDADTVIDNILCYDDFSLEVAEDAFYCSKEVRSELTSELTRVFLNWVKKHGLEPEFFLVDCVSEHVVPGETSCLDYEDA